jgi:hypothetical protein
MGATPGARLEKIRHGMRKNRHNERALHATAVMQKH